MGTSFCPTCGYENESGQHQRQVCARCSTEYVAQAPGPKASPLIIDVKSRPTTHDSATPPLRVATLRAAMTTGRASFLPFFSVFAGLACCLPGAPIAAIISGVVALRKTPPNDPAKLLAIVGVSLGVFSAAVQLVVLGLSSIFDG
jgi:hypothetical protein